MATISLMCSMLTFSEVSSLSTVSCCDSKCAESWERKAGICRALGVDGEEVREVGFVFPEESGQAGKAGHLGSPDAFRHETGGDVDAVEDIAHVVKDVGGDLRHAGQARGSQKVPMSGDQGFLGALAFPIFLPEFGGALGRLAIQCWH